MLIYACHWIVFSIGFFFMAHKNQTPEQHLWVSYGIFCTLLFLSTLILLYKRHKDKYYYTANKLNLMQIKSCILYYLVSFFLTDKILPYALLYVVPHSML